MMSRDIVHTCPGTSFHLPRIGWKIRLGSILSSLSSSLSLAHDPDVKTRNSVTTRAPAWRAPTVCGEERVVAKRHSTSAVDPLVALALQ